MEHSSIHLVLSGGAGQGLQLTEGLLIEVFKRSGYHVFATKEYMSRVRGGINSTSIHVSGAPVRAYAETIDLLVALEPEVLEHLGPRLGPETLVAGEATRIAHPGLLDLGITALAEKAGSPLFSNTVAAGAIVAMLGLESSILLSSIDASFAAKGAELQGKNRNAALAGYEAGLGLASRAKLRLPPLVGSGSKGRVVMDGGDVVTYGALAGGCDFVSGYPMTPGSSVLTKMAALSGRLGIVVEQTEDEIAAVNMAVGAWYAGARALVTTSGGGFALMSEGISLAASVESPLVIHLAERPGPATGMPTRTEQGDLDLALHAGHGDFARVLLSPGDLEEGFALSRSAMDLADRLQAPVFILTDQYFIDSYYDLPRPDLDRGAVPRDHLVRPESGYLRYALTEDGVSPRAIPGSSKLPVAADSHEHDEEGYITEDFGMRRAMLAKRLRKLETARRLALPPLRSGPSDADILVVGWGSTKPIIAEAVSRLVPEGAAGGTTGPSVACLHFPQVFPVGEEARAILSGAKRIIMVENNATGQFADLLLKETGVTIRERVLKSDGLPFSVEELSTRLAALIEQGGAK